MANVIGYSSSAAKRVLVSDPAIELALLVLFAESHPAQGIRVRASKLIHARELKLRRQNAARKAAATRKARASIAKVEAATPPEQWAV